MYIVGRFLHQKIRNVITSGYYLRNGFPMTNMVSCLIDVFLTSEWKELFTVMGNIEFYLLLTRFSVFFQVNQSWLQLTGPPLSEQLYRMHRSVHLEHFAVSSLFYRLSFPKTFGFPSKHIFSRLLQFNARVSGEFIYKSIHHRTALLLMHEVLRSCYPHWSAVTLDQEMDAYLSGQIIRMRYPPRLKKLHLILGKILYCSSRTPYGVILERMAALPLWYQEHNAGTHYDQLTRNIEVDDSVHPTHKAQSGDSLHQLLSSPLSTQQVFSFILSCLHRLLPHSFLSTKHNWRVFFRHVYQLLTTTNRRGIRLAEMVSHIRLGEIDWLRVAGKPSGESARFSALLLSTVISFVIRDIIVLLPISVVSSFHYCQTISTSQTVQYPITLLSIIENQFLLLLSASNSHKAIILHFMFLYSCIQRTD